MSAGPDVERLISGWLEEEAVRRAPDRVLASACATVLRTRQRREAAFLKESHMRLIRLAAAILVVAAVGVGGYVLARNTAPVASPPSPAPSVAASVAPTAAGATLSSYRGARNAICAAAPKNETIPGFQFIDSHAVWDPKAPAADRAAGIAALEAVVARTETISQQLEALDVPPDIYAEHIANIASGRDGAALLQHEIDLLKQGKLAEALAVDEATDATSGRAEAFEKKYGLIGCP